MMMTMATTTITSQEEERQPVAAAAVYHTFGNSPVPELSGLTHANQFNTYEQQPPYYDKSVSENNYYYDYRDSGRRACYAPSYQEEFWQRPKPVFRPQGQLSPISIRYKPQQQQAYLFRNCSSSSSSMYYCTTTNIDYRHSFPNSSAHHQFNGQYQTADRHHHQQQQQQDGSVPFIMANNGQYVTNCTPIFDHSGNLIQPPPPPPAAAAMGPALNPHHCAQFYPLDHRHAATGCYAQQVAQLRQQNINYDGAIPPPPPPAAGVTSDMMLGKDSITDEIKKFQLNRSDVQMSRAPDPSSLPLRGHYQQHHHPGYLGGGTFGYVCSGMVHGNNRCAIKVSRGLGRSPAMGGQDPQFVREVTTLSKLQSHPNIVTMLGFVAAGQADDEDAAAAGQGSCLIVMEEMATSLQAVIEGVGPLPVPSTLTRIGILRDVSSALHFMHSQGYVHRDIKPANVLLSHSYIAKLCDFGGCFTVKELDNGAATAACATVEAKDRLNLRDPPNAQLADMMDVADACMIPDDRARPSSRYLWDHFAMAFSHLTSSYSTPTKPCVHRGTSYRRYFSGGSAASQQSDRKKKCKQSTMPPNIRRVFVPKSGVPLRSPTVLVGS